MRRDASSALGIARAPSGVRASQLAARGPHERRPSSLIVARGGRDRSPSNPIPPRSAWWATVPALDAPVVAPAPDAARRSRAAASVDTARPRKRARCERSDPRPSRGRGAPQEASDRARASPRASHRALRNARGSPERASSGSSVLLVRTSFAGASPAAATCRMPYPVEGFLLADPFVALMTLLSTHTVYRALWWSGHGRADAGLRPGVLRLDLPLRHAAPLLRVALAQPLGRHHRGKRVEANKTHAYQRVKYYLLYAFLLAAACGQRHRRAARPDLHRRAGHRPRVLPALSYVTGRGLDAVSAGQPARSQQARTSRRRARRDGAGSRKQFFFPPDLGHRRAALRRPVRQPLDPAVLVPRALPARRDLGVIARHAVFGMEKDHSKCTDCNLCLVDCQGADSPQGGVKWRRTSATCASTARRRAPRTSSSSASCPTAQRHVLAQTARPAQGARHAARAPRAHPERAHQRHARHELLREAHPARRARWRSASSWSAASAARSA
jgi:hypothetical protein